MAEKKLAVVFTSDTAAARKAIAELNGALGSTEAQAKKTGGTFQSALGGVALAAGIGFAVSEFEDAEATARKTEAVIKSTGNAAQVTAGQQDQMVASLSKLAAVDDEVVAGGANVLRTFKSIQGQETFEGALEAALNLSAALGTDLQSASMQVGKALEDPLKGITALTRAGVSFSAGQKEQIRNFVEAGDKASAQKMILAELETQFGGQAEAAVTSSARMKVALGNTAEAIGSVLAPAFEAGAQGAEFLATSLDGLPGPAKTAAVVAGLGAVAWSRWGDTALSAASKGADLARTLNSGLDGIAATRGITKTQAGVEALKASLSTSVSDFGKFKSGAVAAAAGIAAFGVTLSVLDNMSSFHGNIANLSTDLDQLGSGMADLEVIGSHFGGSFDNLAASFGKAYDGTSLVERGVGSLKSALTGGIFTDDALTGVQQAQSDIEALDQALGQTVTSGNVESARAAYGKLSAALIEQGVSAEDVARFMPKYWDAIERADRANADAAASTDTLTRAQQRMADQLMRAASSFGTLGTSGANAFRGLGAGIDFAEQAAAAYTQRALGVFEANQAYDESTQALTQHQRDAAEVQAQNAENTKKNADALRQHAAAVQQAADQVAEAAKSEKEAQDALAQAYADARPEADAMVEAARRVADAQEGTVAAAEASRVAQENLNQAYVDGAQYLKNLAEANSDNATSVEAAQLAYDKAIAAQAELVAKPSDDPFAARDMALRVKQALDALEDAQARAAESSDKLTEANAAGVDKTPQVVAAREAIATAAEGEVTANGRLEAAQKQQAETQATAAENIAAAQGRLSEATAAVSAAQANLAATQSAGVELTKNEAIVQEDLGAKILANAQAKLDLATAEAAANGHTLTAAESAAILRAGMDEGRASTGFWSTDLETLGQKLDYAANSRTVVLDTVGALARAKELGQRVEELPDGSVRITADTSQATGALDALGLKIGALGSQLTANLGAIVTAAVPGFARGGDVSKGETAVVGENGPELVTFGADGHVTDAARTRALLSSAGTGRAAGLAMAAAHGVAPTIVHLTVEGSLVHERDLPRFLADALNKGARSETRPLLDPRVTGLVNR